MEYFFGFVYSVLKIVFFVCSFSTLKSEVSGINLLLIG